MPLKSRRSRGGIENLKKQDKEYKEIKRALNKRAKKGQEEEIIETVYVDTYRMISVNAGSGNEDLKSIMAHSGRKIRTDDKLAPGEPDLHMYLRLADHLMKKGLIDSAMQSITEAADFNPESPLVLMAAAKCHTMTGHWEGSLQAVEAVLQMEPKNTKAVLFKAEALFNLCQFEAALVFFHRGQMLNPDLDDFRFGIQKSRKTITDAMKDETVFTFDGVESLFKILRGNLDVQDKTKNASYVERSSQGGAVAGILGVLRANKNIQKRLQDQREVQKETTEETNENKAANVKRKFLQLKPSEQNKAIEQKSFNLSQRQDRLAEDKAYLSLLSNRLEQRTDIRHDRVQRKIKKTTSEALDYLKKREAFWDQLELRKEEALTQCTESYRFLM